MLCEGDSESKSRFIVCEVCKQATALNCTDPAENEFEFQVLTKQGLRLIVVTLVSVALVVLPLFASDYPLKDKTEYLRILTQWPPLVEPIVDMLIKEISEKSVTGRVHVKQFI